jgi:sugar phosphate isomerase/epimerase
LTSAAPIAFAIAARLATASPAPDAWSVAGIGGVRGVTIGPIEDGYHPDVGYGSPAYDRALVESRRMGATWIALTPFGRVADLTGTGIDLTFEAPFDRNRRDVARAVEMAHARGLHVMLVPHLWVESGDWRALIDPRTDEGWARWADSYARFTRAWALVAETTGVEMFSAGVELRSWVTTARAPRFTRLLHDLRRIYHGVLTYSANWDDVDQAVVLGDLDVIGINAFYPLADAAGATEASMAERARDVRAKVHDLAERWGKPVVFTEIGYTTRTDPALRPWEWPDAMSHVTVDENAQAQAYRALVEPMLDEPDFAGFFVWRLYADPDDTSQEAPWGFSPRGKLAEGVVRDAFTAPWACDPTYPYQGYRPRDLAGGRGDEEQ